MDPLTLAQLIQGALTPATTVDTVLRMPFVSSQSEESYEVGVGLFLLPETAAAKPGFAVMPYGSAGIDLEIGLSELLTLVIGGTVKLDGGVGALVRPDKDLEFLVGFGPGTPSAASGTLSISLVVGAGEPMVLLGDPEASRFELDGASALGGVRFHSSGKFEVYVEFAVQGAQDRHQARRGQRLLPRHAAAARGPDHRHRPHRRLLDHPGPLLRRQRRARDHHAGAHPARPGRDHVGD